MCIRDSPYDIITSNDAEEDVKAVFNQCHSQSLKCLLVGDLHTSGTYKKLSEQYGFIKNYLEEKITFKTMDNNLINLDYCLSNDKSILVSDIIIHETKSKAHGHLAITYKLKI